MVDHLKARGVLGVLMLSSFGPCHFDLIGSKHIYTTTAPGSQIAWISSTTLPSKSCHLKGAHHEAEGLQPQAMGSERVHTVVR